MKLKKKQFPFKKSYTKNFFLKKKEIVLIKV